MSAEPIANTDMPLEGRSRASRTRVVFSPILMIGLILTGLFAFSSLVLLSSYSDDLRPDDPSQGTAQDPSAVGYLALYKLLDEAGVATSVDPYPHRGDWDGHSIRLYFPTPAFSDKRYERIDPNVPGVLVLPKWQVTQADPETTDVVRRSDPGLTYVAMQVMNVVAPDYEVRNAEDILADLKVGDQRLRQIKHLQFIAPRPEETDEVDEEETIADEDQAEEGPDQDTTSSEDDADNANNLNDDIEDALEAFRFRTSRTLQSLYPDQLAGHPTGDILFSPADNSLLILAEPDLLNNQGLKTQSRAEAAMALISEISQRFDVDHPVIVFDDSLRRRDTRQNLVKLLTRPPFLAATLCLLAAGGLVGWQGANRFADPVRNGSDRPQGSATLARTAAQFIRGAGRLDAIADDYAAVARRQVIHQLGLGAWNDNRIDAFIAKREATGDISPTFADIKADQDLTPLTRARAFQRGKKELLS